jgi:hypothetical protein
VLCYDLRLHDSFRRRPSKVTIFAVWPATVQDQTTAKAEPQPAIPYCPSLDLTSMDRTVGALIYRTRCRVTQLLSGLRLWEGLNLGSREWGLVEHVYGCQYKVYTERERASLLP